MSSVIFEAVAYGDIEVTKAADTVSAELENKEQN